MHVEVKDINKSFGRQRAVSGVSFGLEKGRLVGLLGPSGSGKTTILRLLAGLETPDSGDIILDGERINDLAPGRRGIGFVFQHYALFRHMTVFGNIAFGLEVQKMGRADIRRRVGGLIRLIGLEGLEGRRPHQLSGGQRQRVAFARALAPNPRLLLLDEPFAAIDAKVRRELRSWLRETISRLGLTSLFVTHDQDEAVEVADEIIITNGGRIEQIGTPAEIYKNPLTPFAAGFIGEALTLGDYGRLRGYERDERYGRAIVRPEFVQVTKAGREIYPHASERAVVEAVSFRGSSLELKLKIQDMSLTARRSLEEEPVAAGEEVSVLIYRLYLYNDREVRLVENASFRGGDAVMI